MGVSRCEVCSKCGTTLAQGPNTHPDPVPHDPMTVETRTTYQGQVIVERVTTCCNCRRTLERVKDSPIPVSADEQSVEAYIRKLLWSDGATEWEKSLVACNLRTFAAALRATVLVPAISAGAEVVEPFQN